MEDGRKWAFHILAKRVSGRGIHKCKSLDVGGSLACSQISRETDQADAR